MRTNIDIDDDLLRAAMAATGQSTKKATVEACLQRVVQLEKQASFRQLFGKIEWEGNLEEMRRDSAVSIENLAPNREPFGSVAGD